MLVLLVKWRAVDVPPEETDAVDGAASQPLPGVSDRGAGMIVRDSTASVSTMSGLSNG